MSDELLPVFKLSDVELLERKSCYQGFMRIDRLTLKCRRYEGGWSGEFYREVLLRLPGVGVLLYDPDQDVVLLVEQFRAGCLDDEANGPWALELVAGMLDSDEDVEQVAIREAREEAGVDIGQLIPICRYYNSPGGSNERLSIYCARFDANQAGGIFGLPEENENIRTVKMSRAAALAAIESGRINNAMSIIALQWLQLNLSRMKAEL
ncbi:MAG: NUDIX domain-containing protein [Pseudomonadota bacterium]